MNIADFPFDTQICVLKFSSWVYDSKNILLNSDKVYFDNNYIENPEWNIDNSELISSNASYNT